MKKDVVPNAEKLVALFGGVRQELAAAIGVHPGVVSRWLYAGGRGTGGHIPPKYNKAILRAAVKRGISVAVVPLLEKECPTCGRPH